MGSGSGGSGGSDGDVAILREALELEAAAVARYVEHAGATSDPRLFTYWESLRRNEAGHSGMLQAELRRLAGEPRQPAEDGEFRPPRSDR
jgi:rubrerythrin